jgi:hypothetical protein
LGTELSRKRQPLPRHLNFNGEASMAHWRKGHESAAQFNSVAGFVVGAAVVLGALAFILRHVHV